MVTVRRRTPLRDPGGAARCSGPPWAHAGPPHARLTAASRRCPRRARGPGARSWGAAAVARSLLALTWGERGSRPLQPGGLHDAPVRVHDDQRGFLGVQAVPDLQGRPAGLQGRACRRTLGDGCPRATRAAGRGPTTGSSLSQGDATPRPSLRRCHRALTHRAEDEEGQRQVCAAPRERATLLVEVTEQAQGAPHCPPERPVCGHGQACCGPPPPQPPSDKAPLPGGHGPGPHPTGQPLTPLPAGTQATVLPTRSSPRLVLRDPSEAPGGPGPPSPAAAQHPGWPSAFLLATRARRSSRRQMPPHSGIERGLLTVPRGPNRMHMHGPGGAWGAPRRRRTLSLAALH